MTAARLAPRGTAQGTAQAINCNRNWLLYPPRGGGRSAFVVSDKMNVLLGYHPLYCSIWSNCVLVFGHF
jgi:hypothetical protein